MYATILHLNLKGEYFNDIQRGDKKFEYRLCSKYWRKRLNNGCLETILFKNGYPKKGDKDKIIEVPYRGYEIKTIEHKHFGEKEVEVFAIFTGNDLTTEEGIKIGVPYSDKHDPYYRIQVSNKKDGMLHCEYLHFNMSANILAAVFLNTYKLEQPTLF